MFMFNYKRLLKLILNITLILVILKVLSILVLLLGGFLFPESSYKMHLPWNKIQAIQTAQEYFEQNYKKEIRYDRMKIYSITETRDPYYFYRIYFKLCEEPVCDFKIDVDYELKSENYTVEEEYYLKETMNKRMEKDTKDVIKKLYKNEYEIIFSYDLVENLNENITLEDIKSNGVCYYSLILKNYELKNENIEKEAQKLYNCYIKMKEKGYLMSLISYNKKVPRHRISGGAYKIFVKDIESVKHAEQLISEAINDERR